MSSTSATGSVWYQLSIALKRRSRGCHYITDDIKKACSSELAAIEIGVMHITLQHTSASIALNEVWDKEVLVDAEMALNKIAPESWPYQHSYEGKDDMPAHLKCMLVGASLSVPITKGELRLGTWQGVWLCEHRDSAGPRALVVTIQGAPKN